MRAWVFVVAACMLCGSCRKPPPAKTLPRAPDAASRMGFVDLIPLSGLTVTNAYFKAGSERKLDNYIGTQEAHFQVEPQRGLRLLSLESHVPQLPNDQPPALDLVAPAMRRFKNYRYYYAVVFAKSGRGSTGSAVLLGANSMAEIERMGTRLLEEPDSVCGAGSKKFAGCTVFPKNCTVSVQIGIIVNGKPQALGWGARLGSIAPAGKSVRLTRTVDGREVSTDYEAGNPAGRGAALLPGDRIQWEP